MREMEDTDEYETRNLMRAASSYYKKSLEAT